MRRPLACPVGPYKILFPCLDIASNSCNMLLSRCEVWISASQRPVSDHSHVHFGQRCLFPYNIIVGQAQDRNSLCRNEMLRVSAGGAGQQSVVAQYLLH